MELLDPDRFRIPDPQIRIRKKYLRIRINDENFIFFKALKNYLMEEEMLANLSFHIGTK